MGSPCREMNMDFAADSEQPVRLVRHTRLRGSTNILPACHSATLLELAPDPALSTVSQPRERGRRSEERRESVPASPGLPQAGQHFLDYRIVRQLGAGGMGAVFEVERDGKRYALKVIQAGLSHHESYRARFEQEATMLMRLDHPGIVWLEEHGRLDGIPYLVMDMLEGMDLRAIIRRDGPLDPDRALEIVRGITQALTAALEVGLVHRDIKPENIVMVGWPTTVAPVLIDFGLVKQIALNRVPQRLLSMSGADVQRIYDNLQRQLLGISEGKPVPGESLDERISIVFGDAIQHAARVQNDQDPINLPAVLGKTLDQMSNTSFDRSIGLTLTGQCLGTPSYMSPEMWAEQRVDERADMYSVGVTWYFMVSGAYPHEAASVFALRRAVLQDRPIPIVERNESVPDDHWAVMSRLLARRPAQRYSEYQLLLADIDRLRRCEAPHADFGAYLHRAQANARQDKEYDLLVHLMSVFCEMVTVDDDDPVGSTEEDRPPLRRGDRMSDTTMRRADGILSRVLGLPVGTDADDATLAVIPQQTIGISLMGSNGPEEDVDDEDVTHESDIELHPVASMHVLESIISRVAAETGTGPADEGFT